MHDGFSVIRARNCKGGRKLLVRIGVVVREASPKKSLSERVGEFAGLKSAQGRGTNMSTDKEGRGLVGQKSAFSCRPKDVVI